MHTTLALHIICTCVLRRLFISYYGQPTAEEIHNGSKNIRFKQLPFNVIFSLKCTEGGRKSEGMKEGGTEELKFVLKKPIPLKFKELDTDIKEFILFTLP